MKKTPFAGIHESLGAKMADFAGYYMPIQYSSIIDEHHCVRQKVGVFDVSHMGEFILKGPGALDLLQKIVSNDVSKLDKGQAQYAYLPNNSGGIVDDLLVYHLDDGNYMCVVNAANIEKDWAWFEKHNSEGVEMYNISDKTALLAVQGPKAAAALQSLTEVDLEAIPFYRFVRAPFAGVSNVIISATGYTGSGGFELYFNAEHAVDIWEAIFKAGAAEGVQPVGLGARDTLRLEKGYCLYGNDIDDTTSPVEAGLSWVTDWKKDFVGKAHILEVKNTGSKQKLVGIKMLDRGIPRKGYDVADQDGNVIGKFTSGSQSPSLSLGIGLAYVAIESAKPGSKVFVPLRGKSLEAEVVKVPFV